MRYVIKGRQPDWYQTFRQQNRGLKWREFSRHYQHVKKDLNVELLREQHFLCGYCGKRINEHESHIEHIIPRAKVQEYQKSDLSYDNLLASCPEDSYEDGADTCGHAKGSWYDPELFVSPHDQDCESYFTYTEIGQIMPASSNAETAEHRKAITTINRLALDNFGVMQARRAAIEGILGDNPQSLTQVQKDKLLQILKEPDDQGRLMEYCFVIMRVLESSGPARGK